MLGKLKISGIIKAHFSTLRNYGTGRIRPLDVAAFTLLPLVFAAARIYPGINTTPETIRILVLPALVMCPALALILSTIYRISTSYDCHRKQSRIEREFIKEIVSNIFYALLMAVLSSVAAFVSLIARSGALKLAADSFVLFLVASFFLALLMILNRTYVLISKTCSPDED
jgi:hypothetical protein